MKLFGQSPSLLKNIMILQSVKYEGKNSDSKKTYHIDNRKLLYNCSVFLTKKQDCVVVF